MISTLPLVFWISLVLKIAFVLVIVLTFAPVLVWAERRQSAMMQDRVGPVRAGFRILGRNITLAGLLHPLADALKMIWKEDFVPPRADKFLHAAAPIIALVPAVATFAVIPFGPPLFHEHLSEVNLGSFQASPILLQVASLNVGILFIFAVAGTGVVGAAIAGYSSDSKYALLGGLRAAGQMVSYEVVLGLTLVGTFMIFGTLRLEEMVAWQNEHVWGIFVQPLAFVLFFTAAVAETKRIPFDLPEAESELAAGYFTEYSGMKFGMFFMGEFIEVVVLSSLIVVIFLGGYDLPFVHPWGVDFFGATFQLSHGVIVVLGAVSFLLKVIVLMWFQLIVRWSLPRFRYDQVMSLCWKCLLPLALLNILATGIAVLAWPALFG